MPEDNNNQNNELADNYQDVRQEITGEKIIESSQTFEEEIRAEENAAQPAPTVATSQGNSESIILQSRGYLENLLQKSVSARVLNLTLYTTHLKIEDANTGEFLEDVALDQITKTTRYIPNRFKWSLYTMFFSSLFILKTPKGHYRISWVDRDAESYMFGSGITASAVAQQNYPINMQWVGAIKSLQHGESVQPIGQLNATGLVANMSSHFSSPNKGLGYFLIFFPLLVLLSCGGLFAYSQLTHTSAGLGFLSLIVGTLVGLPMFAFGLLFGLRKIR